MRTFLRLKNQFSRRLPAEFQHDELRYADELVATFLRQYTRAGDTVLDPFAGYGTTLIVAEAMGRAPYGVEADAARAGYIRTQLERPERLIHGDARQLLGYGLPPIDVSITSPPYMAHDEAESALAGAPPAADAYAAYLAEIARIYTLVRELLRPGARAVLEVSNLKGPAGVTTLAWDIGRAVAGVLEFEGEVVVGWDHYNYGYDHSYCLVFRRPG